MANLPSSAPQAVTGTFEQFLLDHGFLNKSQQEKLQAIKFAKHGSADAILEPTALGQLLIAEKILDDEDVAKARAAFLNLPYVDLEKVQIPDGVMDLVPVESRRFYQMIPYELNKNELKIALEDPSNIQALEALEFLGQKNNYVVRVFVASHSAIDNYLSGKKRSIGSVVKEALQDLATTEEQEIAAKKAGQSTAVKESQSTIEDAPVIKIVDVMLANAIEGKASDIHIEPSENDVRVRYRIDGILQTSLRLPKNVLNAVVSRIKILSNLKIDEHRLPQDGRFHVDVGKKSVDLRVSILPLMFGEKIVMRILDKTNKVPTLEELGLRGRALKWVNENIQKTHGVFLITGPTGSGKSSTLYSILTIRNTTEVNIVTLEDPVEYFIEGVNQSQIKPEIGLTFASGLRSILRQDPNIVMVGEIRDEETAELAVHAALTGHLVFSTLHTNNSVGAIPRLMNMGIEQFLLAASTNLIMAQRLIRKLCNECKKETKVSPVVQKELEATMAVAPKEYLDKLDVKNIKVYEAVGCEKCGNIGYKGRMGIFEVLPMFDELQELLFNKQPAHKIYEAALKLGMITMKQDGLLKVMRGETTIEEIARVTTE
ncbi:MAG TPA: ATPase, T2SS/T4P/T4SS family [Candidatus Doudnabacteria bacterium]|nr:ATPase, T2SS/T4P/T4SS family [Candidatus Doudnabacteria bacterium]